MSFLPLTLISIIEVLLILVPALLAVAYVTVAERKTMASMQRRLGPNQVGLRIQNRCLFNYPLILTLKLAPFKFKYGSTFSSRQFHVSKNYWSTNNKHLLAILMENRLAPVITFLHDTLITCSNILDAEEKTEFFNKLSNLIVERKYNDSGVIYIFQYKHDPNIYYIGRTTSLRTRLNNHLSKYKFDKFHIIAKNLGWENFILSVVEINESSNLIERENYFLSHYKPLLNTLFRSFYSASINKKVNLIDSLKALNQTEDSLTDTSLITELEGDKDTTLQEKDRSRFPVWVYKWTNENLLSPDFIEYSNRQAVSNATGVAVHTINRYLDTKLPKKGGINFREESFLFFSYEIKDLTSLSLEINKTITLAKNANLRFDSNVAKEIWAYVVDENNNVINLNDKPFKSLGEVGAFFSTGSSTILYYLENFKPYKGNYFFSNPLDFEDANILIERHILNKNSTSHKPSVKVWAYLCDSLNVLNNVPFPTIQAASDYLKVGRRTILNYLNTDLILKTKDFELYLYNQELSPEKEEELVNNYDIALSKLKSAEIWVYNESAGQLQLSFDKPFSSINQVSKALDMFSHTIKKYLDSDNSFKNFYFYSVELNISNLDLVTNVLNTAKTVGNLTRKIIWVYREIREGDSFNLVLVNDEPFNTITIAAKELQMSDMTINKYLDTDSKYKGLYFYSEAKSKEYLLNIDTENKKGLWVYTKVDGKHILLENQPFKSKWVAAKALNISYKNIDKLLDTGDSPGGWITGGDSYKNFYSQKLAQ